MGIPFFNDLVMMFALGVGVVFLCQKLHIPSVVGLLITGILAGPNGMGLVSEVHNVEKLAELGVILLLFTIGIEFSLGQLLEIKKDVLVGGMLQVALTALLTMLTLRYAGYSQGEALFVGFLVALSSTAIVLKIVQDRAEINAPYGRSTLAILIFQDIVIIPIMLFTPVLAKSGAGLEEPVWMLLFKVALVLGMLWLSSKWIAPWLLLQIARQRSRELFLLSIVAMCLVVAWFTSYIGLSVSLGAFLAGLIISESEYSHQALGNILPFKDVFTSIFFVSVGMLLNVATFIQQPVLVIALLLAVVIGKSLVGGLVILILGFPLRTAVLSGLALCQIGEFSFILSRFGMQYNLLSGPFYQVFLAVSVSTMVLTPFIINLAPRLADLLLKLPLPLRLRSGAKPEKESPIPGLSQHLIIIGFGVNGRNLARAASSAGIPYVVIEQNPDTVRDEKEKGEPILFGDATQPEVLHFAELEAARVVVIAISDPAATVRITDLVRRANPGVSIIVRTRYIQEIEALYKAGANDVIPEEFETSLEIFSLVLKKYMVPRVDIEKFTDQVRADGYEMLRSRSRRSPSLADIKLHLHDAELVNLRVEKCSPAAGKTLAEMELRSKLKVAVLLIQRGQETMVNPGGEDLLLSGDQAVVLGSPAAIDEMAVLFRENRD